MTGHISGRAIVVEPPKDQGDRFLIVSVRIECDGCGSHQFQLAGHHLRALRDLCVDFIKEFPELTGTDDGVQKVARRQYRKKIDPSRN